MTLARSINLFAVATVLSAAAPAFAANVIDQNAPTNNTFMASFNQADLAQSFKQTASNISGAGIFLQAGQGTGNSILSISLWTKLPNVAGATMLTTASAANNTSGHWFDVFWTPVATTAGATYYLVFDDDKDQYGISGDTNNGYANGQVFANAGYTPFPTFDYTFRTYTDNAVGGAVPEPATWAMMLAGFGLTGAALRRRRQQATVSFA